MKVLQTLGTQGGQHGIFQYMRTDEGVYIDIAIGTAKCTPEDHITLTNKEWQSILASLKTQGILNLTGGDSGTGATLHEIIMHEVQNPKNFSAWTSSYLAAVCAILQHEGSIDYYAGPAGRGVGVSLHFKGTF